MPLESDDHISVDEVGGTLSIHNVILYDEGSFTCRAYNTFSETSHQGYLEVAPGDGVSPEPTSIGIRNVVLITAQANALIP